MSGVALRAQFFEHARGFDEPGFFAGAGEGGLRDAGRAGGDEQQRDEKFIHGHSLKAGSLTHAA